eukprot:TRINITY_DN557_c0_g3_i1.p1 TRINITY_DN557_c0_g3~~TRINITY_DN557_c0_g3_i1.p1  ORF type:complete len:254 (+),score=27.53 TRINITY_DN557_c0_g3_i1:103-864(+)
MSVPSIVNSVGNVAGGVGDAVGNTIDSVQNSVGGVNNAVGSVNSAANATTLAMENVARAMEGLAENTAPRFLVCLYILTAVAIMAVIIYGIDRMLHWRRNRKHRCRSCGSAANSCDFASPYMNSCGAPDVEMHGQNDGSRTFCATTGGRARQRTANVADDRGVHAARTSGETDWVSSEAFVRDGAAAARRQGMAAGSLQDPSAAAAIASGGMWASRRGSASGTPGLAVPSQYPVAPFPPPVVPTDAYNGTPSQ